MCRQDATTPREDGGRFAWRLGALAAFPLVALLAGCPADASDPGASDGQLIVGVQAEDFGTLVDTVHIVAMVDGKVASDQTIAVGTANPGALPKEITLTGAVGARAEIVVDATTTQAATRGAPNEVVTRRAAVALVSAATKKLLRMQLETRCSTFPQPGGTPAPTCAAPLTCASGRCTSEEVPVADLEDYETDWATSPPDICRPANHGAPELQLGTGQTDFAPLTDGQTLQLERGPQGGHHIWIATRMKNLRQSGSRTQITGQLVKDPSSPIAPAAYVFTYDRDEGNYCKLWGLRFQLDGNATDLANDYKRFLGQDLQVTVQVTDSTNATASSTKTIHIDPLLLCPDGTTTSCN